jgi:pilus assembly protein Flp/PilA
VSLRWSNHIQRMKRFINEEDSVKMIEYALLAALIAVVCTAVFAMVGARLYAVFSAIGTALATANG